MLTSNLNNLNDFMAQKKHCSFSAMLINAI